MGIWHLLTEGAERDVTGLRAAIDTDASLGNAELPADVELATDAASTNADDHLGQRPLH